MKCARCQHDNRPGAKFCEECAAPLARACTNCGASLGVAAKFCSECAQPAGRDAQATAPPSGAPEVYTPKHLAEKILTSKAALEGERKQGRRARISRRRCRCSARWTCGTGESRRRWRWLSWRQAYSPVWSRAHDDTINLTATSLRSAGTPNRSSSSTVRCALAARRFALFTPRPDKHQHLTGSAAVGSVRNPSWTEASDDGNRAPPRIPHHRGPVPVGRQAGMRPMG